MPKYCSENERVKRDYAFFLETASGKQDATIDAALRAIDRFETRPATGRSASFTSSRPGLSGPGSSTKLARVDAL